MAYKSIFEVKPKKENKLEFCERIKALLNNIEYGISENGFTTYYKGETLLNFLFSRSKLNTGYANISDILNEAGCRDIFNLVLNHYLDIPDEEILANIDLIVNCFYSKNIDIAVYYHEEMKKNVTLLFKAIRLYLLSCGYKLIFDEKDNKFNIVENEIAINIEEINNAELKSEVINFYDYKNAENAIEKRKIILILINNLECRKNNISKIMGTKIADMFSNYANNFNLRHNNINKEYKKYYNPKIDELNNKELVAWYNYIFAFMFNIYISLDKLKDVNVNDGYK